MVQLQVLRALKISLELRKKKSQWLHNCGHNLHLRRRSNHAHIMPISQN